MFWLNINKEIVQLKAENSYSRDPNKGDAPNKGDEWKNVKILIRVMHLIRVMLGKLEIYRSKISIDKIIRKRQINAYKECQVVLF